MCQRKLYKYVILGYIIAHIVRKSKFKITRASATSAFGRRGGKKARNISRSNPTSKTPPQKKIPIKNDNQIKTSSKKKITKKRIQLRILQSTQQRSKRQSSRKVSGISVPSGSGKFTRAVDVGRGKMQDVVFTFSNGTITNKRKLGKPVPQSRRFKEKRRR